MAVINNEYCIRKIVEKFDGLDKKDFITVSVKKGFEPIYLFRNQITLEHFKVVTSMTEIIDITRIDEICMDYSGFEFKKEFDNVIIYSHKEIVVEPFSMCMGGGRQHFENLFEPNMKLGIVKYVEEFEENSVDADDFLNNHEHGGDSIKLETIAVVKNPLTYLTTNGCILNSGFLYIKVGYKQYVSLAINPFEITPKFVDESNKKITNIKHIQSEIDRFGIVKLILSE